MDMLRELVSPETPPTLAVSNDQLKDLVGQMLDGIFPSEQSLELLLDRIEGTS